MEVSDRILLEFRSRRFGWIFPDGSVVVCDHMKHLGVLPQETRELYSSFLAEENDKIDDILYDEQQSDPDSHPAMHRFDAEWDALVRLYDKLYSDGYARLGLYHLTSESAHETTLDGLEVHSTSETLETHRETIWLRGALYQ